MGFTRYLVRRLLLTILVLIGVLTVTFVLARYVPGDPVYAYLGERAREEQVQNLRKKWGLDKSLFEQYVIFIVNLLNGDLGVSIRTQHPVVSDLAQFFPFTIELSAVALLLSIIIGIPLGIVSAVKRNEVIDHISRVIALSGSSMPIFWLGLVALGLLYYRLGWFPGPGLIGKNIEMPTRVTGFLVFDSLISGNWPALISSVNYLILPALVVGSYSIAITTRIVRSGMLEVLNEDFIRTARAKGLPERVVIYVHAFRNTLTTTVTVIGLNFGSLLSGAIITETVFSRPGLGTYAIGSMLGLDYPAIVGTTLVIGTVYVFINLAVDLLYSFLDPRIRYG